MGKPESATTSSQQKKPRTLRFLFQYEGNQVQLVSQQSVTMIPPPPTSTHSPKEGQEGFWYELRDSQDHSVYYRAVANPIPIECEVFSEDQNESICRQEVDVTRGTFVLLAPDLPEATSVLLFSPPLQRTLMAKGTSELVRFNLSREGRE